MMNLIQYICFGINVHVQVQNQKCYEIQIKVKISKPVLIRCADSVCFVLADTLWRGKGEIGKDGGGKTSEEKKTHPPGCCHKYCLLPRIYPGPPCCRIVSIIDHLFGLIWYFARLVNFLATGNPWDPWTKPWNIFLDTFGEDKYNLYVFGINNLLKAKIIA